MLGEELNRQQIVLIDWNYFKKILKMFLRKEESTIKNRICIAKVFLHSKKNIKNIEIFTNLSYFSCKIKQTGIKRSFLNA